MIEIEKSLCISGVELEADFFTNKKRIEKIQEDIFFKIEKLVFEGYKNFFCHLNTSTEIWCGISLVSLMLFRSDLKLYTFQNEEGLLYQTKDSQYYYELSNLIPKCKKITMKNCNKFEITNQFMIQYSKMVLLICNGEIDGNTKYVYELAKKKKRKVEILSAKKI